jgi:deazaflavin-dependent oxidoreductase (nitroreductase family)
VWSIKRLVSPLQRRLLQLTGGRFSLTGRAPVLLLTTTGRRSGKERTTPLFYLRDGDRLVVCNANPGFERPNPWTLNLRAAPQARVLVGGHSVRCRAREATPSETDRYWRQFVKLWPAYRTHFDRSGQRTLFVLEETNA